MSNLRETSSKIEKLEEYSRLPHYMEKEFLYIMYERDKEKIKKLADIVPLERLAAVFNMPVNNIKYILE